ncbi:MAG: FHA domain-containing protein, partial [Bdellovibrionales bacterium]|nr:FHA domain-containing protein [Bdellovibrionales bacterium]
MSEAVQLKPLDIEIEVLSGPHRGQRFSFAAQEVITIGRDPENDVGLVNDPRVSRFHAEIKYSEGSFYIHNKSDKNYILINGIKDEQALIGSKSNITIGETEIKVIIPDLKPSPTPVLFDNKAVTNESQIIGFKSPLKPLPSNPLEMPMIHPNTPSYPTNYVPASVGAPQVANTGNKKRKKIKKPKKDNNLLIYVFGIIAIALIYLMIPKKVEQPSKKTPIITPVLEDEARLKRSEDELEKARERMRNMDSRKQMARQFFVSGMREYNNGQY